MALELALRVLGLPAILSLQCSAGVSAQQGLDVNSLAVPRAAKEAIGGIARMTHKDGHAMTINVEYNQLEPVLLAGGFPKGDVPDETGHSPFPGKPSVTHWQPSRRNRQIPSCFRCQGY